MKVPSYFSIRGRPVKLVETEDGGVDVLALNLENGHFERDLDFLTRVTDIDTLELSEADFGARVAQLRESIARGRPN